MQEAIVVKDLVFSYPGSNPVLNVPAFSLARGEKVFLHGPSGSGKTTLLGLLTGILQPQSGVLSVLGQDLTQLSGLAKDRFRGAHIGYIFQMFNLIPYLSVLENIALPCQLNAVRRKRLDGADLRQKALELACALGLEEVQKHAVTQLSVGQQQRVAAARALLGRPEIIIADEPTSALDADMRKVFIEQLFDVATQAGSAVLFVSHDWSLQSLFDRHLALSQINKN